MTNICELGMVCGHLRLFFASPISIKSTKLGVRPRPTIERSCCSSLIKIAYNCTHRKSCTEDGARNKQIGAAAMSRRAEDFLPAWLYSI